MMLVEVVAGEQTRPDLIARGAAFVRQIDKLPLPVRSALMGGGVLLVIVVTALAAPLVSPYDPIKTNQRLSLAQPSIEHLMGTDRFGRDILSRVLHAERVGPRIPNRRRPSTVLIIPPSA